MAKNIVGISIGDPGGIGPEILMKALPLIRKLKNSSPFIIGDATVLRKNLKFSGERLNLNFVKDSRDFDGKKINAYDVGAIAGESFPVGEDSGICGRASFLYVKKAVGLWKECMLDGLVTLPISKKAWHLAGKFYSGHTEFLASALGAEKYAMIMAAGKLKVLLVTAHVPLREVSSMLTKELIVDKVLTAYDFLIDSGVKNPVIALSAVNPHGGEGGILGQEERKLIVPAAEELKRLGINCTGPLPADAVFRKAMESRIDLIVAMYHDQALIPLKTFWFNRLVNVTAGLDMVRTSPGHGTGFDIAYRNKADPSSFVEAYKLAAALIRKKPRRERNAGA